MPPPPPGGDPWGYGGGYGNYWAHPRYMRRAYRRYYRWGPYWQWRSVFVTGAVAGGFWWASEWADLPGVEGPVRPVAIILTHLTAGHPLISTLSPPFLDKH